MFSEDQMSQHSLRESSYFDSSLHCEYNEKLKLLIKTYEFTAESGFSGRRTWITQSGAELACGGKCLPQLLLSVAATVGCGIQQKYLGNCFKTASIAGNSHPKVSLESSRELMNISHNRPS